MCNLLSPQGVYNCVESVELAEVADLKDDFAEERDLKIFLSHVVAFVSNICNVLALLKYGMVLFRVVNAYLAELLNQGNGRQD